MFISIQKVKKLSLEWLNFLDQVQYFSSLAGECAEKLNLERKINSMHDNACFVCVWLFVCMHTRQQFTEKIHSSANIKRDTHIKYTYPCTLTHKNLHTHSSTMRIAIHTIHIYYNVNATKANDSH